MKQKTPAQLHRRQAFFQIILPAIVFFFLVVLMMIGMGAVLNSDQISIVTDLYVTLCCLVPAALMCLIPALALMFGALYVAFEGGKLGGPLERGRLAAIKGLQLVQQKAPIVAKPVSAFTSQFAFLESFFTGPNKETGVEEPAPPQEETSNGS